MRFSSPPAPSGSSTRALLLGSALVGSSVLVGGCRPEIGDKCIISTDCSTRGDRLCDTSQPGGYCTQFNCRKNSCPDEAACVLFNAAIPGCGYDDRAGPYGSRVARSFCVASCETNDDCRSGYVCAVPRDPPWNGRILDDEQNRRTCLVSPAEVDVDAGPDAAPITSPGSSDLICNASVVDAAAIDATAASVGRDAAVDPPLVPDAGDAGDAGDASDGG